MDSFIFDLDGTMWDTTDKAAEIWTSIVNKEYPDVKDKITGTALKSLYGLPLEDIAVNLFKSVSTERAIEAMTTCARKQCDVLSKEGAILMGDVEGTLKKLKTKYKLFIVSNCKDGYIQSFLESHKLGYLIDDFECPGMSGLLKADNIRLIMKRNNLYSPVYVGDTQGDCDASKTAGVPFAFAKYGFGTVDSCDYVLESCEDLEKFL